ncbi:MAG: GNAT family N-acetyltransferase [Leptothrix sp. (in: b-proteobacteria)]
MTDSDAPADTFLYFAYGSNMSSRRLQDPTRAPSAVPVGQASLAGYRLVFDKASIDGSGKADCERTGDLTDRVFGGLFRVSVEDTAALDKAEGAAGAKPGYRHTEVVVATDSGPTKAVTYLATNKLPDLLPYPWYIQHVLAGAREFGLPADYIAAIQRLPTQPDLKPGRPTEELSIYASPLLRREVPGDAQAIQELTKLAFRAVAHSSHTEHLIVDQLRAAQALSVSLVVEVHGELIGHVAVSPVEISDGSPNWYGLGPISVSPTHQRQGVGTLLMNGAISVLRAAKASGCVLLGDPA